MISLRYHAVSIAAVFLALAIGVVLGAGGVSDRLLGAVSSRTDELAAQVQTLTAERDALAAAQRASDEFAQRVGPAAVTGLLQGESVALVTSEADPADRDAVLALLEEAGALLTGEVALTPAVGDPARADQLRELTSQLLPTGAQLPAASDTGSLVGGLLGGVLLTQSAQVTPAQADAVLSGLATAGFVAPGETPGRADLVLVLTGGAFTGLDAADAAAVTARMAAQLDRGGSGAVLAGRTGSAEPTGPVGVARADPEVTAQLSTVDNVDTAAGRVSTVLALREQMDGRAGRYGSAVSAADGATPEA
ncbi:copper transporter [Pseudonocardia nigra]|uniref:copper transporter n=1 Tax=Pseudonocardia nigra TaxID=1921578 RepID=UPI001C5EEA74|nr:copper transporter [Pseudonocardia nigra]